MLLKQEINFFYAIFFNMKYLLFALIRIIISEDKCDNFS